jgi:hypothetical protein
MQNLQVTKQSADFVQTSVRLDSQSQRAVLGVGVGKRFVIDKYSTAGFNLFTLKYSIPKIACLCLLLVS